MFGTKAKKKGILILVLCFSLLTGCGKNEAVQAVEEQIAAILMVDRNALEVIEAAESAFYALEAKEQKKVENYDKLVEVRDSYDQLLANDVSALIEEIGIVDKTSDKKIRTAEDEYSALSDSQKEKVGNYDHLVSARDTYDQLLADEVSDLVDKIGTVDETSDEKIRAAENAYSSLNDTQKSKVRNVNVLEKAREQYCVALVNSLQQKIDSIQYDGGEPSDEMKRVVNEVKTTYVKLDSSLQKEIKNYDSFEKVSNEIAQYYIQQAQVAIDKAIETDSDYEKANTLYFLLTPQEREQISNYGLFSTQYAQYKSRPPLKIENYTLKKDIIGNPELYIKAKNTTDKAVKEFSIHVFAYDSDGIPVPVYLGDYTCGLRYSQAVKAGEYTKNTAYWQLYGTYSEMKQFVIVVGSVEFFDGSEWENNQLNSLITKYEQKILNDGDKNIIPRA